MMELVIYRSKWLRGEGSWNSRLIRSADGKMCCFGFLGLACGIPAANLLDKTSPDTVGLDEIKKWPTQLLRFVTSNLSSNAPHSMSSHVATEIMSTNDSTELLFDDRREVTLGVLFAEINVNLTFED